MCNLERKCKWVFFTDFFGCFSVFDVVFRFQYFCFVDKEKQLLNTGELKLEQELQENQKRHNITEQKLRYLYSKFRIFLDITKREEII